MFYFIYSFFSCFFCFYIGTLVEKSRIDFKLKETRVNSFSLGRKHGIRIATIIAKQSMSDLAKYIKVHKVERCNQHEADMCTISFIVDRKL